MPSAETIQSRIRTRLRLEGMEERLAPAVFTVTSLLDDGVGSLRQAIASANATPEADTINFQSGLSGTVRLSTAGDHTFGASALAVTSDITIDGVAGGSPIAIARDPNASAMRLFDVSSVGTLTLKGLTVSGGITQSELGTGETSTLGFGKGGAIYNQGKLTIVRSTLSGNQADGTNAAPAIAAIPAVPPAAAVPAVPETAPGDGQGGAIFNDGGTLTLTDSTISGNSAVAGTPLADPTAPIAHALGGGVFSRNGNVSIENSTITNNTSADGGRGVYSLGDAAAAITKINNSILGQSDTDVTDFAAFATNGGTSTSSGSNNLIRTNSGFSGTIVSTGDPMLAPLAQNGLTASHALMAGSPAIDAGTNPGNLTTDQSGNQRTSNSHTDIGAVEVQSAPAPTEYVVAAGVGGAPHVRVLDTAGNEKWSFFAYDQLFTGGVRAALGDVNGDGVKDIVTVPGSSGGPNVKVFDGVTGQEIRSFFAYDEAMTNGLQVAVGDVNGDGFADIITAPEKGSAHIKVFSGKTGEELKSFFAYDPAFTGGATVATADINKDGFADIITGTGSGAPHVRVFSGMDGKELRSFFAIDPRLTSGVTVAAGDINGDGTADILVNSRLNGAGAITIYDGATNQKLKTFAGYEALFDSGITMTAKDVNGDGRDDILVGSPHGAPSQLRIYDGATLQMMTFNQPFADFTGGVTVAS